LIVLVVVDKIGWFSLELEESCGIEPFREFNFPIIARINKSIHSSVKYGWCLKVFGILRKVICIFQWKSDKVTANDFSLEVGSNKVSTFQSAVRRTSCDIVRPLLKMHMVAMCLQLVKGSQVVWCLF
jgi:hypothetical protein